MNIKEGLDLPITQHLNLWLRLLRIRQWSKNSLLLLVPLLAHSALESPQVWSLSYGFFAFCFVASAGYILNDYLDLTHDQSTPYKNNPLSKSPVNKATLSLLLIFTLAIGLTFMVLAHSSPQSYIVIGGYFLLSCTYSGYFKRIALLDLLFLSFFYLARLFYGGVISDLEVSPWLLSFSLFFFFSLSICKRVSETQHNTKQRPDRAYTKDDLAFLNALGITSGMLSVLVFAIYIQSEKAHYIYSNFQILWFTGVLLLYWISRIWFFTNRKIILRDPLDFVLKDKASYVVLLLLISTIIIAH